MDRSRGTRATHLFLIVKTKFQPVSSRGVRRRYKDRMNRFFSRAY